MRHSAYQFTFYLSLSKDSIQGWQVFAGWWKKPVFTMVKTVLAKIVFAGKNTFWLAKKLFVVYFFFLRFYGPAKKLYVCSFVFSFQFSDQKCSKTYLRRCKNSKKKLGSNPRTPPHGKPASITATRECPKLGGDKGDVP